jgi:hypothetical protein
LKPRLITQSEKFDGAQIILEIKKYLSKSKLINSVCVYKLRETPEIKKVIDEECGAPL